MRRKPGQLLPLEVAILRAGVDLHSEGESQFHGYLIASRMRDAEGARMLTAHGTLYKALDRLRSNGLLESEWEDPTVAAAEERPRRRLYRVTAAGERALSVAEAESDRGRTSLEQGLQPS